MPEATMTDEQKQRVKDALISHLQARIESAKESVSSEDAAAEVDETAEHRIDDTSHSDEAGDLTALFENAAARQSEELASVEALDFAVTDSVSPGAIISLDGDRFVVGAVTDAFECDGESYEGLSTDSPVYEQIKGLKAGETYTFNDREHRIDFVS